MLLAHGNMLIAVKNLSISLYDKTHFFFLLVRQLLQLDYRKVPEETEITTNPFLLHSFVFNHGAVDGVSPPLLSFKPWIESSPPAREGVTERRPQRATPVDVDEVVASSRNSRNKVFNNRDRRLVDPERGTTNSPDPRTAELEEVSCLTKKLLGALC